MARHERKWVNLAEVVGSDHDIISTTFAGANNQASAANVTDFAFANADVRGFRALVTVVVDATADLYEVFDIIGVQKTSDWDISTVKTGDDSLVDFSITSSGQIQYTSGNYAGFNSLTITFRALANDI